MSEDAKLEILRTQRAESGRLVYFLLAAVGAALGFAVNQTQNLPLSWQMAPLGGAVLMWCASLYCGYRMLQWSLRTLWINSEIIDLQRGVHPMAGRHREAVQIGLEASSESYEKAGDRVAGYATWQFRFLMIGGAFFLAWHIWEMYLRTA